MGTAYAIGLAFLALKTWHDSFTLIIRQNGLAHIRSSYGKTNLRTSVLWLGSIF